MISAGILKFGMSPIYFLTADVKDSQHYYSPHVLRYMTPEIYKTAQLRS